MTTQKFPMIQDKSSGEILPVISASYKNNEIIEVAVWMDDDIFVLEKGEFEVIERWRYNHEQHNKTIHS